MNRILAITCVAIAPLAAEPLSQKDRDALIQQLERTRDLLLNSIRNVTPAQWTFKAGPDRWSIAECAEHILNTEPALRGLADGMVRQPVPTEGPARRITDTEIIKFYTDRSQKAQAPEIIQPKGKVTDQAALIAAFEKARAGSIAYVRSTQDDLRGHWNNSSRGAQDAYQYLLMMAGHTERHTMQIEEVKTAAGYPK